MALKDISRPRRHVAFQLARRAGRPLKHALKRRRSRAGILMYHRVAVEKCDPWDLCVTPAHFAEHMAVLADFRAQADLGKFGDLPTFDKRGSRVAVTFDDGYSDNITQALPLLEKYDIPATIFVVSSAISRKTEFWWDALTRAVLESALSSPVLELELPHNIQRFQLDQSALGDSLENMTWRADQAPAESARQELLIALWETIVSLPPTAQYEAVDQVLSWAGCSRNPSPERLPATEEAIAALGTHPLVKIGSHTKDHVSLTDLNANEQRVQIEEGHKRLETIVGRRIDRFSYPFGRFDQNARLSVMRLGVDFACTSHLSVVTPRNDQLALSRLQVKDAGGLEFEQWLQREHALLTGGI